MIRRFWLVLLLLSIAPGAAVRARGLDAKAPTPAMALVTKPGDCAACHKDKKVLPAGHVATKDFSYKDCLGCHVAGEGTPGSLRTHIPLWHIHALNGVKCAQCHGNGKKFEPVEMYKCVSCHDTKALALKTADLKPTNPHNSRHYGTEADCNLCHHQHRNSQNNCADCHKFAFIVP